MWDPHASPGGSDALPDTSIEGSHAHSQISGEQSRDGLVADLATKGDEAAQDIKPSVRRRIVHSRPADE